MADNRVKQVVDAIETAVTGLATTGSNVFVHPANDLPGQPAAALVIRVGSMEEATETINDKDWLLEIAIDAVVHATSSYWENILQIEKEVYAAMRASYNLGLSWVHDCQMVGASAIEVNGEGTTGVAANRMMTWQIHFRHSLGDISA